jgi:hypothetical protein
MNVRAPSDELQQIYLELNRQSSNNPKVWEKKHFISALFDRSKPHLLVTIEKVNQLFSRLEQSGVKIFDPTIQDDAYLEKARCYRESRRIYFDVADEIGKHLSTLQKISPEIKKAYLELRCREVGLRYSLGQANGGLDALDEADEQLFATITQHAEQWKKKQKQAVDHDLNQLEKDQLKELAKYPELLKVLLEDPQQLKEIFDWCLRDFNQVEVLVKCFETRRRLKAALLSGNLGYVRNIALTDHSDEVLAFRTLPTKVDHIAKRILTIPIYHGSFKTFESAQQERINILKPAQQVCFKQGNYTLTVEEFLKQLGEKNKKEVNISLCADWGFVNFHPVRGVWNADLQQHAMPSMTEKDWTDHVPAARIASHEELVLQYGKKVENRPFFFKVMATRTHSDLNALDCHALWQLYIRMGDGNWKVLNVGTYAYRFQQGLLDGLWLFCASVVRVLSLMDQNGYYTHRQRGAFPIFEDVQDPLLASIYNLMISNGVFQFSGRNCAYSVQTMTGKFVQGLPNFFKMPLTEGRTGIPPLDGLLALAHRQWEWVRWLVVSILHTVLLSHRRLRVQKDKKEVVHSMRKYFSEKGHHIFNPSYLPYQIANARKTGEGPFVEGELYWSHTDEKLFQASLMGHQDIQEEFHEELIEDVE